MMGTGFNIGFGFGFHGLGMLIFWGGVLFFVILLGVGLKTTQSTRDDSAMKILEKRLARDIALFPALTMETPSIHKN